MEFIHLILIDLVFKTIVHYLYKIQTNSMPIATTVAAMYQKPWQHSRNHVIWGLCFQKYFIISHIISIDWKTDKLKLLPGEGAVCPYAGGCSFNMADHQCTALKWSTGKILQIIGKIWSQYVITPMMTYWDADIDFKNQTTKNYRGCPGSGWRHHREWKVLSVWHVLCVVQSTLHSSGVTIKKIELWPWFCLRSEVLSHSRCTGHISGAAGLLVETAISGRNARGLAVLRISHHVKCRKHWHSVYYNCSMDWHKPVPQVDVCFRGSLGGFK